MAINIYFICTKVIAVNMLSIFQAGMTFERNRPFMLYNNEFAEFSLMVLVLKFVLASVTKWILFSLFFFAEV